MPWLDATTPAQRDGADEISSIGKLDRKGQEDRVSEAHLTTKKAKQSERKSVRDKVVCTRTLHMFHFP